MSIKTTINLVGHEHLEDSKWCACGEIAKDCYYLALVGPAYDAWQSMLYADLFSGVDVQSDVR